jgi:hemerythrin
MKSGAGKVEVLKTLTFLEKYVITHFNEEEKIQLKTKYPGYSVQKQEHDMLRLKLLQLKNEIEAKGVSSSLVINVQKEMSNWWYSHINELDTKLGEHINSK